MNEVNVQPPLKFVGIVHSLLTTLADCPLQENENAPEATIEVFEEFTEGIKDIKIGSRIMLLTWLHKADRSVIKCVSRNNYDSPPLGVFSTRSPDRPNPIGIHIVTVRSIAGNKVKIANIEVIDQTPLIDIKPVL